MSDMTDQQVLDGHDDLEFLKRRHLWPWDLGADLRVICVKKPGADVTAKCVFGNGQFVLYATEWTDEIKEYNVVYESPEAIIADGWVID